MAVDGHCRRIGKGRKQKTVQKADEHKSPCNMNIDAENECDEQDDRSGEHAAKDSAQNKAQSQEAHIDRRSQIEFKAPVVKPHGVEAHGDGAEAGVHRRHGDDPRNDKVHVCMSFDDDVASEPPAEGNHI